MAKSNVMVLDLTNYKDRVSARVEPGTYTVVIDDAEQGTSANQNPKVTVYFRVVGGNYDGATLVDFLTLTEAAMFRMVGLMNAVGMKAPRKRIQVDLNKFIGKTLQVEVDDDTYNGRTRSKVQNFMKAAAGSASVADVPDTTDDSVEEPDMDDEEPVMEEEPVTKESEPDEDQEPEEIDLDSIQV